MRKALIIGINDYPQNKLRGCKNDAISIRKLLNENEDSSHNFDTMLLLDEKATYENIQKALDELYENDDEVTILYFSGHGYDDNKDGTFVTVDMKPILFKDIMSRISMTKCKYNIVFLDCCHSGKMGNCSAIGDKTVLSNNTVILTACRENEGAIDEILSGHGTFTNLLIGALQGGASDLLGRITPGSIYAYIDQALSSWQQRPYFKANVSAFVSLRSVKKKISVEDLKKGMSYFPTADYEYELDSSYEDTNVKKSRFHKPIKPYAAKTNVEIFKIFQKMNQNGLLIPKDEDYMYFAAMHSKKIVLTELGKHYWRLCKNERI